MGRINLGRVVIGGLLAGLLINIGEFILNGVLLAEDMSAAMAALNKPPIDNSMIVWFVLLAFGVGFMAVWLYAAIRPRFGPGVPDGDLRLADRLGSRVRLSQPGHHDHESAPDEADGHRHRVGTRRNGDRRSRRRVAVHRGLRLGTTSGVGRSEHRTMDRPRMTLPSTP